MGRLWNWGRSGSGWHKEMKIGDLVQWEFPGQKLVGMITAMRVVAAGRNRYKVQWLNGELDWTAGVFLKIVSNK
jgi:hypothetical protein